MLAHCTWVNQQDHLSIKLCCDVVCRVWCALCCEYEIQALFGEIRRTKHWFRNIWHSRQWKRIVCSIQCTMQWQTKHWVCSTWHTMQWKNKHRFLIALHTTQWTTIGFTSLSIQHNEMHRFYCIRYTTQWTSIGAAAFVIQHNAKVLVLQQSAYNTMKT